MDWGLPTAVGKGPIREGGNRVARVMKLVVLNRQSTNFRSKLTINDFSDNIYVRCIILNNNIYVPVYNIVEYADVTNKYTLKETKFRFPMVCL